MTQMRANVLPILEAGGVDLVLAGHSHSYERSYLLDGHYGTSGSLTPSMKKDGGSGRVDGTGAYNKPTAGPAAHEGAVYGVAGSSGKISGGALNHPAMFVSLNVLGSMVLDVTNNRLDARFIDNTALVRDYFTITKGAVATPPAIATTSLPGGTVGTSYSSTLSATGGILPYTWSLASGQLPAGLSLAAGTGAITGVPSGTAGTSAFRVRVVDSASPQQSAEKDLSIAIAAAALPRSFGKTAPKNNAKNQATSMTLSWAASTGAASYEYCVDTTNDNACAGSWVSTGATRQASVTGLARNVTYFWQVRARNGGGTTLANAGTWWRFSTRR
jgi:hypothetical protein